MPKKYKNKYRIESNRFQFWDYSSPGSYFITICVSGMVNILGKIINNKMNLSKRGKFVHQEILELKNYHASLNLDTWQIMPNHLHLLLTITEDAYEERIHEFSLHLPKYWNQNYKQNPSIDEIKEYRKKRRKMLIPKAIGKFKAQSSKRINLFYNTPGCANWQTNYHDHIIRNKNEFFKIRNYIIKNPKNWRNDNFFHLE